VATVELISGLCAVSRATDCRSAVENLPPGFINSQLHLEDFEFGVSETKFTEVRSIT